MLSYLTTNQTLTKKLLFWLQRFESADEDDNEFPVCPKNKLLEKQLVDEESIVLRQLDRWLLSN